MFSDPYYARAPYSSETYSAYSARSPVFSHPYSSRAPTSSETYSARSQVFSDPYSSRAPTSSETYSARSPVFSDPYSSRAPTSTETYSARSPVFYDPYSPRAQTSSETYSARSQVFSDPYSARAPYSRETYSAKALSPDYTWPDRDLSFSSQQLDKYGQQRSTPLVYPSQRDPYTSPVLPYPSDSDLNSLLYGSHVYPSTNLATPQNISSSPVNPTYSPLSPYPTPKTLPSSYMSGSSLDQSTNGTPSPQLPAPQTPKSVTDPLPGNSPLYSYRYPYPNAPSPQSLSSPYMPESSPAQSTSIANNLQYTSTPLPKAPQTPTSAAGPLDLTSNPSSGRPSISFKPYE